MLPAPGGIGFIVPGNSFHAPAKPPDRPEGIKLDTIEKERNSVMGGELKQIFALMIPIVAIVMGIGIGMLYIWTNYLRKREMFELHHKERLSAIERGMEVPALPPEFFDAEDRDSKPVNSLRRGLILLLVGLAIGFALYLNRGMESAAWGLIPAAVGLAYLISYWVEGRNPSSGDVSADTSPKSGHAQSFGMRKSE